MNHVVKQQGFTIIELLLSMTFVSVLLLAIALSVVQMGNIYNKGTTLKEVNQAGRAISDDISRNLKTSSAFNITANYHALPTGGRLCTDGYSYLWNYAEALQDGTSGVVEYEGSDEPVHFVKVPDGTAEYCAQVGPSFVYPDIRAVDQPESAELLSSGDRLLSIHDFTMSDNPASYDTLTGQQLYSISFVIGTSEIEALNDTQTACEVPSSAVANFTYCAVQQFDLVVRAGSEV